MTCFCLVNLKFGRTLNANYELVSGWVFERDPCLFFILDSSESFGLSSTSSIDLQQPGWFCWHELE